MSERIRIAGAPENEQLLEAAAILERGKGKHNGPLTSEWDQSGLICLRDRNGRIALLINADDFVALGGTLPE